MSDQLLNIARAERETLRWVLLLALSYARPVGTSEYVLLLAANDAGLNATQSMVRQELDYLKGRSFVTINSTELIWQAAITPDGMDLVDYRGECPKGIARPKSWGGR